MPRKDSCSPAGWPTQLPALAGQRIRWLLADVAPRLLPELNPRLSRTADRVLRRRGVEVRTEQSVEHAGARLVRLTTGEDVATRSLIWCVGVRPDHLVDQLGLPTTRGRLEIDETLVVRRCQNVFAAGDCAAAPDLTRPGQITGMTAQHAQRQGKTAARNVAASLAGRPLEPYRHRDLGFLVDLGGASAAADPLTSRCPGRPRKPSPAATTCLRYRATALARQPTGRSTPSCRRALSSSGWSAPSAFVSTAPSPDRSRPQPEDRLRCGIASLASIRCPTMQPDGRQNPLYRCDDVVDRRIGLMTDTRDTEFEQFVRTRRAALLRTASLLAAGDVHLAEDVVQTCLTRLYLAWPRARKHPLDAYVRRILVNAFIDEKRRPSRRETAAAVLPDSPSADEVSTTVQDPELLRALATLPVGMRAAVVLRHVDDLSVDETAAALRCSTGNVKSQTARGLDKLREQLGPQSVISTSKGSCT